MKTYEQERRLYGAGLWVVLLVALLAAAVVGGLSQSLGWAAAAGGLLFVLGVLLLQRGVTTADEGEYV
jgi:hypothetical protein